MGTYTIIYYKCIFENISDVTINYYKFLILGIQFVIRINFQTIENLRFNCITHPVKDVRSDVSIFIFIV